MSLFVFAYCLLLYLYHHCCLICFAQLYWDTAYTPSGTGPKGSEGQKSKSPVIYAHALPEPLPPEWSRIRVRWTLRKRLSMQKKQHRLHPILPLHKEKDVPLIHHHQQVQQLPTKIIVVFVWRICRWMLMHLHV